MSISLTKTLKIASPLKEIIKALGIVFGDIGTSPIYTLSVIFALIHPTPFNVIGVLSLIVWTLIALVTVQYAWLAMSLSQKGEGGTIVLREIFVHLVTSPKLIMMATLLSFIGISFLIGDGVITPAISILSAVEGLTLIPGWEFIPHSILIFFACIICICLFMFQRWGTETVSVAFGPIMVVWFFVLGVTGFTWMLHDLTVLKALNPAHAVAFLFSNGWASFLVLSKVILCATGGEALYADMGHLGRAPIIRGWMFALVVLIINYLGQGAFLIHHPSSQKVLYEMIFEYAPSLYIPFLILSIIATVIASQAMISGIFSIVYQGITTNILPKLRVEYTSRKLRSQIYIPFVNWSLLMFVLFAILEFKQSLNLANAYGLAASCTMTITSMMITSIFYVKEQYGKALISLCIFGINILFFIASTTKIPQGAYWSLLIALIPLSLIIIYLFGKRRLNNNLRPIGLQTFLEKYESTIKKATLIKGTGLFFSRGIRRIPPYIVHTMFTNNIMYDENIIISVTTQDKPFGIFAGFKEDLAPGLRVFEIRMGYMEIMNIEKILRTSHIDPKVMFYGMEDIETKNLIWKIFALIKKLTPSFVQFYKLPTHKLHGVVMRVEM